MLYGASERGSIEAGAVERGASEARADTSRDHDHDHDAVARLLRALAEPNRLALLHLLAPGEGRVVDLTAALGLAQSTVSAHLSTLRDVGVVDVRREGRSSWYRLVRPEVAHLLADAELVVERAVVP